MFVVWCCAKLSKAEGDCGSMQYSPRRSKSTENDLTDGERGQSVGGRSVIKAGRGGGY